MLCSRGETTFRHVWQRHRHGVLAPGYDSSGSNPAARISATASASANRLGTVVSVLASIHRFLVCVGGGRRLVRWTALVGP